MKKTDSQIENYSLDHIEHIEISKKKPSYPMGESLKKYLSEFGRLSPIPLGYSDLLYWAEAVPVYDKHGNDTHWKSVIYPPHQQEEIETGLTQIYGLLKTDGNMSVIEHLKVAQIDYCEFGNSNPFRIKIRNSFNDIHDYFYVKKVDASRVYGLELEHILSPNRIFYIIDQDTIIEEHIMGIPGDRFIEKYVANPDYHEMGLAKEFVKFNERCFVLLLGDMRSYNYVINITPDFDKRQFRSRTIDFDQFCYEGRKNNYLPQFYKENYDIVKLCANLLPPATILQYQYEERMLIKKRANVAKFRLGKLLDSMAEEELSTKEKIASLAEDLNKYHRTKKFNKCNTMGKILRLHLNLMVNKPKITLAGKASFKKK